MTEYDDDPVGERADTLAVEYDEALVFSLSGEVDAASVPAISRQLRAQMTSGHGALVVDLTGVTFLDSSGISLLFDLATRLERRRQQYAIVAPREQPLRSVLGLAGIEEVARLAETVSEALTGIEPAA